MLMGIRIIAFSFAVAHDHPELRSLEAGELIGQFFQNMTDNIAVRDDMGLSGRIEAEFSMSKQITQ